MLQGTWHRRNFLWPSVSLEQTHEAGLYVWAPPCDPVKRTAVTTHCTFLGLIKGQILLME